MLAYVLASFNPGTERDANDAISKLKQVKETHILFGEWDIIIKVEVSGPEELEKFIIDEIRSLPGNRLTSTMIVAK
jgi:DNA-binding Lrp family transcriptional regulator